MDIPSSKSFLFELSINDYSNYQNINTKKCTICTVNLHLHSIAMS